jgi:hypothetical protein
MDNIRPLADAIAVHRGNYSNDGADYSVTELLNPPRVVFLNKRHAAKVPLFVQDLLHSYNGTGSHNYMEYCLTKMPGSKYECETRLRYTVNNRLITGAFDMVYDSSHMYDLKNTSCWKGMFGDKFDWAAQSNIYRWMYHQDRDVVLKALSIIALFRDWNKNQMFRSGPKYPKYPAVEYKMPVWELDETWEFMEGRVNEMIKYEDTPDDDLPECTYEDMWSEPDQVAVMSTRLKSRALRVLSSMKAAKNFVNIHLAKPDCKDTVQSLSYEVRPAVRKRCVDWCPVNNYCCQYQKYLADQAMNKQGGKP